MTLWYDLKECRSGCTGDVNLKCIVTTKNNKVIHNRIRMQTLTEMLHVRVGAMNELQMETKTDNRTVMVDMSDIETSPLLRVPEQQFL